MRGKPTHHPLAAMAERQHGVVSIRQLTGPLGYSRDAVRRAELSGQLHRLYRGVYAVGYLDLSLQGHCLAAVLASGRGALLSHTSAAWLWGLTKWDPRPMHVTTPVHRSPRPPIVLHHVRSLRARDHELVEVVPITSLPRTLLDLASVVRPWYLERLLRRAEELSLFDLRAVDDQLSRFSRHPGVGRLRGALEVYRPTSFTRSGFEERFLELMIKAGLPQPRSNFVEAGFELDAYWPEERFAVELDTYGTHGGHDPFEGDRRRQDDLQLAGIAMISVTDVRLAREPTVVAERVRLHLARRRRELGLAGTRPAA